METNKDTREAYKHGTPNRVKPSLLTSTNIKNQAVALNAIKPDRPKPINGFPKNYNIGTETRISDSSTQMGLRNREISCGCVIDLQLLHEQLLSEGIAGRRQNRNEGKAGKKVGMTERTSVASQSY
ncbi:hypothetical protein SLE2022_111460 [Rubroshorea leprosula]